MHPKTSQAIVVILNLFENLVSGVTEKKSRNEIPNPRPGKSHQG